jgi:mannose-6-phosphate isomerase-like protein (cupin superfamily)
MNRKGVAERFAALGFGCDIWTDGPGQVWADFVHDVDEIVMLVEGEIEVSFAGKTLRPAPGEEIVIQAGASHTVRNIGKTTNRWYYGYRLGSRTALPPSAGKGV